MILFSPRRKIVQKRNEALLMKVPISFAPKTKLMITLLVQMRDENVFELLIRFMVTKENVFPWCTSTYKFNLLAHVNLITSKASPLFTLRNAMVQESLKLLMVVSLAMNVYFYGESRVISTLLIGCLNGITKS